MRLCCTFGIGQSPVGIAITNSGASSKVGIADLVVKTAIAAAITGAAIATMAIAAVAAI